MKIEDKYPTYDDELIDGKYEDDLNELISEVNKQIYDFINNDINVLRNDVLIEKYIQKFNYSNEKIKIYCIFIHRTISIYQYFNLHDKKISEIFKENDSDDSEMNYLIKHLDLYNKNDFSSDEDSRKFSDLIVDDLLNIFNYQVNKLDIDEKSLEIIKIVYDKVNEEIQVVKRVKSDKLNNSDLYISLKYLSSLIKDAKIKLSSFMPKTKLKKEKNESDYEIDVLYFYQDYFSFKMFSDIINEVSSSNCKDLLNLDINSEDWKKIDEVTNRVVLFSQSEMRKKIQIIYDMISLSTSFVSKSFDIDNKVLKVFGTGFYMANYFFRKKSSDIQYKRFMTNPTIDVLREVWGLLDWKIIKKGMKIQLPSISFREKIYVEKNMKIDLKLINEYVTDFSNKQLFEKFLKTKKSSEEDKLYLKVLEECDDLNEYVKLKLLHCCDWYIPILKENKSSLISCCNTIPLYNATRDALVIHIHGGGFVAMSSSSHENYLRKWCKMLKIPLISIDYRLAPDNKYPSAIEDVFNAYYYIIKYAEQHLLLNLNKIILVGDSAGGNLAFSLCTMCIIKKVRVPDMLILMYPALRLESGFFSPSKLLCLKDQILSMTFLLLVKDAYLPSENLLKKDFILSPIYTPEHVRFNKIDFAPFSRKDINICR